MNKSLASAHIGCALNPERLRTERCLNCMYNLYCRLYIVQSEWSCALNSLNTARFAAVPGSKRALAGGLACWCLTLFSVKLENQKRAEANSTV